EVALKQHISDKTNWRNMLKNKIKDADLASIREELKPYIPEETQPYFIENGAVTAITFPVLQYPKKVKSINFKKVTAYSGVLKGIKGQYLIFDDNSVLNVRNNSGYVVSLGTAS